MAMICVSIAPVVGAVIPMHVEQTTQQAADRFHLSRTHLGHLIEDARIPFRRVDSHRRGRVEEILAYSSKTESRMPSSI